MGKNSNRNKKKNRQAQGANAGVKYYPRSFLWNVLAVILAFLLGIFAALGGLFGVGLAYLNSTSPREILKGNTDQYVKDEYADMNILDLLVEFGKTVQEIASAGGSLTLDVITKYTPILENVLNPLSESLAGKGIVFDVQELIKTPVSAIGSYFQDSVIMPTELGGLLNLSPDDEGKSAIMIALCYGNRGTNEEGGDYTVVDGKFVMNEGKSPTTVRDVTENANGIINRITVESALNVGPSSNADMRYLAYGTEGVHYRVDTDASGNQTIVMLTNPNTGNPFRKKTIASLTSSGVAPLDNAKITDLVDIGENSSLLLKTIQNWTIAELKQQSRIERIRVRQVLEINEDSARLVQAIADWRIKDFSDQARINSLTLGDLIEINDPDPETGTGGSAKILRSLKDTAIGDLSTAVNNLRLRDILEDKDIMGNKILRNLSRSTLTTLAADIQSLSIANVFGDELYSYLDMSENGTNGKTYFDLLRDYDFGGEDGKNPVPTAIPSSAQITASRFVTDGSGRKVLQEGWFRLQDGLHALVNADGVYSVRTAGGTDSEGNALPDVLTYYIDAPLTVTPVYKTMLIDFESAGRLIELPADAIDTSTTGYKVSDYTLGGVPETDETGLQLYYRTELLTYPEADEGETEGGEETSEPIVTKVAYPLLRDDFGLYCIYIDDNEALVRIDFEEMLIGYNVEGYSEMLSPQTDEEGKTVYGMLLLPNGEEVEEKRVYHSVAVTETTTDGETGDTTVTVLQEAFDYILMRTDVGQYFYEPDESAEHLYALSELYEEGDTSVSYTATWTVTNEDGTTEERTAEVDRYISGFWYLFFGGETYDSEGNLLEVIDYTSLPMLELNARMTEARALINGSELWVLYFHDVINANPWQKLPSEFSGKTNLNRLTIAETIAFLRSVIATLPTV